MDYHDELMFKAQQCTAQRLQITDMEKEHDRLRADNARMVALLDQLSYRLSVDPRTADGITKDNAVILIRALLHELDEPATAQKFDAARPEPVSSTGQASAPAGGPDHD